MKIVILDAYAANPGDLSWDEFAALGELTVYDRTAQEDAAARVGDAEISARHANFIVNRGRASSAEVFALVRHVRRKVLERTGFLLRCEVCYAAPDGRCGRLDAFL